MSIYILYDNHALRNLNKQVREILYYCLCYIIKQASEGSVVIDQIIVMPLRTIVDRVGFYLEAGRDSNSTLLFPSVPQALHVLTQEQGIIGPRQIRYSYLVIVPGNMPMAV